METDYASGSHDGDTLFWISFCTLNYSSNYNSLSSKLT